MTRTILTIAALLFATPVAAQTWKADTAGSLVIVQPPSAQHIVLARGGLSSHSRGGHGIHTIGRGKSEETQVVHYKPAPLASAIFVIVIVAFGLGLGVFLSWLATKD